MIPEIEWLRNDQEILLGALKVISNAMDEFVSDCQDANGQPKAPSKQALMRARSYLPPHCTNTLIKLRPKAEK